PRNISDDAFSKLDVSICTTNMLSLTPDGIVIHIARIRLGFTLSFLLSASATKFSFLGALYTTDYCCSEGILEDKIICDLDQTPDLSQRSPQNYPKCGHPVDGHYCQRCALLRKKFKEDLFTSCVENGILQDSSEPSNDNTNIVNAPREPFVVNQDPGKNSSQSPPQINHHCCYGCGDSLEYIFCRQCTCELCGNGAHYGYNCPPKVLIIPDPEPFNNQTIKELPQTVPSFDQSCYSEDGNSFTYGSTSNLVHDSPNVFNPPPQLAFYSCEFCRNDAQEEKQIEDDQVANARYWKILACYDDDDDDDDYNFVIIPKEPDNSLSMGDEHLDTVLAKESDEFIKSSVENLVPNPNEHCQPKDILELFQRLQTDVQNIHEELAVYINTLNLDRLIVCYYDDDEDYVITVTPSLSTEEPDNSLRMEDEHLDTVLTMELDEFIKSSVKSLVPIPSEFEGIPDNMCDVPFHDNSLPLDVLKDQFEDFSYSNDEPTSTDDDSFSIENIEYVEASPPDSKPVSSKVMEIVISEVGGIDDDILLTIKDDILREKLLNINLLNANIKALNDNPTPSSDFMTNSFSTSLNSLLEETSTFDNSVPEIEIFCFDLEEISSGKISSGSTTTHSDYSLYDSFIFDLSMNPFPPADKSDFYKFADELTYIISPPEYAYFFFKIEPNSGDFMDVVEDIFPIREPRVHNVLPTHPNIQLNLDFILSSESLFSYVVWIFLPFLSYSVAPQYLLSLGNEDTIFNPSIFSYNIPSFRPDVSHQSRTFIKFKVLNESPMEILISTCSPID
nr:hypothetical protein [Tanacetum cinerariifolium]